MKIWQQSAGDGDRNYVDICLRWSVILNGPSYYGAWDDTSRSRYIADGRTSRKCTDLERFVSEMKDGEVVVLRRGASAVHGVGRIVGDYLYHPAFEDIDGWQIAHVRRVKWAWQSLDEPRVFDTYTLNIGDTTQLLPEKAKEIREWATNIVSGVEFNQPLIELPREEALQISLRDACKTLYDCGLSSKSVSSVHERMQDLAQLAGWYRAFARGVSETETVGQLVIPLLIALGWSPQTLAMEWGPPSGGKIDLAAFRPFRKLVRSHEDITMVVEAKKLDSSCLKGFEQVRNYAADLPNCMRIIVTEGMRYAIFARSSGNEPFPRKPAAYLNLLDPKDDYPALECAGADEALLLLSSAWYPGLCQALART